MPNLNYYACAEGNAVDHSNQQSLRCYYRTASGSDFACRDSSDYWAVYNFFASQSHHKYIKNIFLFPAKQMTAQFLPFVFCFIRELNPLLAPYLLPLPPRALSLWLNRVKDSTNLYPPLTLTLRPPIRPLPILGSVSLSPSHTHLTLAPASSSSSEAPPKKIMVKP